MNFWRTIPVSRDALPTAVKSGKIPTQYNVNGEKMKEHQEVFQTAVLGAGASGMMAAIAAARCGASVVLVEGNTKPGKKILATGNGKCNFTNEDQGLSCYRGENPAFVLPVFQQFDKDATLQFFQELGILPWSREGYYYPFSGQASSVQEVLLMELKYLSVPFLTDCRIAEVKKDKEFVLYREDGEIVCRAKTLIVATGGKAAPATGSDGFGFQIAKQFGHRLITDAPALVPLLSDQKSFRDLAGIRTRAKITLWIDGKNIASDSGELQLTNQGISGIPVFQLSRFASLALSRHERVMAEIDFLPEVSEKKLQQMLYERLLLDGKNETIGDALTGLLHRKLHATLCKTAGLGATDRASLCNKKQIARLAETIHHFKVSICGTKGYEFAQTTAGGVATDEIEALSMESRLCPGLYFAGEVVDIDGICGGYNLQWAWSSGFVAGTHAAIEETV